jgi:hypothetical protein
MQAVVKWNPKPGAAVSDGPDRAVSRRTLSSPSPGPTSLAQNKESCSCGGALTAPKRISHRDYFRGECTTSVVEPALSEVEGCHKKPEL